MLATPAFADDEPVPVEQAKPATDPALVARLRELFDNKDYVALRRELVDAYAKTNDPQWLFALGQVELQLQHYQAAIDAYDRFIATKPPQEQIDLAQQAIGAARIQQANQKPRRHRYWNLGDTLLVVGGGLAIGGGAGLFAYGNHKSKDQSGTLTDYANRLDDVEKMQAAGVAIGALGVAAITVAIIRWRLRPEDGYEITVSASGASASVSWRW